MSSAEKVVLILVGFVGSGKSAFATALERHFPHQWRRCNQDDLGSRAQVEALARDSLHKGLSICIDRTNIDESQRAHWIRIAHEFPGTLIWVIFFDTPYEICALRLRQRRSHPTIHSPELGLAVLSQFAAEFSAPSAQEGFHRLVSLKPADTRLNYLASDISNILDRVRCSEPNTSTSKPRTSWAEKRRHARYTGSCGTSTKGGNEQSGSLGRMWQRTACSTGTTLTVIDPIILSIDTAVSSRSDEADRKLSEQGEYIDGGISTPLEDSLGVD